MTLFNKNLHSCSISSDPQLCHTSEHYLELDTHLSMNLQGNKPSDKIADPNTDEPNSQISHSTFPHCPKACKVQSMTWDKPVNPNNAKSWYFSIIMPMKVTFDLTKASPINNNSFIWKTSPMKWNFFTRLKKVFYPVSQSEITAWLENYFKSKFWYDFWYKENHIFRVISQGITNMIDYLNCGTRNCIS